jgi:two-component system, OmpR family, response regulator RstA
LARAVATIAFDLALTQGVLRDDSTTDVSINKNNGSRGNPVEQEAWQVLIVEDDQRLAELTRDYLQSNGLRVTLEGDGACAAERIIAEQPDLVILDLMLPGEDGLSICRKVRDRYDGPILMLTARTDDTDQIQGLDMGADDFVCKPVHPRVLLARIHALLRRSEGPEPEAATNPRRLVFGPLVVDNALREAWLQGNSIELTSAEFDLLWLLVANAGRILSREEIFTALRGFGYDGQDRSIDVRISRIRPKIGDDPIHPRLIKTIRSKGYLFVPEAAQDLTCYVLNT